MSKIAKQLRGSGDCQPGCGCLLCEAANEIERLWTKHSEALQAIGLLTTLGPGDMPIDVEDLMGMAAKVEAHVRARIAELEDECAKHVETIGDRNRSLRLAEDHMDWFRGMCDDKDREIEALKKQLGIK